MSAGHLIIGYHGCDVVTRDALVSGRLKVLRQLDNAVFTYLHGVRDDRRQNDSLVSEYQVVRGAFPQGTEVNPNSGFRRDSHIQLAVREQRCVAGWFLPPGAALLPTDQLADREAELAAAKARFRKPRRRAQN